LRKREHGDRVNFAGVRCSCSACAAGGTDWEETCS
jgi:hypothetical protein